MLSSGACRLLRRQLAVGKTLAGRTWGAPKWFSQSRRLYAAKPVLLADIGEGIVECEVIQWFVQPGARVEEFSPLCEVQSDKASVEITSRFAGTVKKLYYEAGDMAKVGKPFVDIDIEGGTAPTEPTAALPEAKAPLQPATPPSMPTESLGDAQTVLKAVLEAVLARESTRDSTRGELEQGKPQGKMATLATPAVRHVSRELQVDIAEISGTGRDGRVLKQDIYQFVQQRNARQPQGQGAAPSPPRPQGQQMETQVQLSHTQQQMFKTMSRSLSIPHFVYADEVDFTRLVGLRARLNNRMAHGDAKLSYLPFIIKAVSLALHQYPTLNARVDVDVKSGKPCLMMRSQHNVGVAMDTPQGLLVPVIKDVSSLSIATIATELARLQGVAQAGRLGPGDLSGGTLTVSNIGTIGGTYLSPVIVEREVAILGLGRLER
ncbi:hypothetical protein CDD81_5375 [Ophiocordyceps australis]|uniref:Dihydrolipoamide acetyltransferase component of pyruvate dehydrogenase complex n=1 Tax=Ophiocordyceps australis TaxID=1399860 RepID=A0A2C5XTZ3_9HYPO|nr:hypothetical protein CDD81_5375 [Ophiocordyceps australis]